LSGVKMSADERLAALFSVLVDQGLSWVIGTVATAKKVRKELEDDFKTKSAEWATTFGASPTLPEMHMKDAALYVDLTRDGDLHIPERVAEHAVVGGVPLDVENREAIFRHSIDRRSRATPS
jgi:hypothetical protein